MGIFCMIFGVIVFLASLSGGYFLPQLAFAGVQFFPVPATTMGYVMFYVVCGFLGILMGLPIFMQGLIYQRIGAMARRRRRRREMEE